METNAQHTPGPHTFEPLDPAKYPHDRECAGEIVDMAGRQIATVWKRAFADGHPDADEEGTVAVPEAEANGRLFAAAPDLLAVCERAARVFESLGGSERYVSWDELRTLSNELHVALQKARGEVPS